MNTVVSCCCLHARLCTPTVAAQGVWGYTWSHLTYTAANTRASGAHRTTPPPVPLAEVSSCNIARPRARPLAPCTHLFSYYPAPNCSSPCTSPPVPPPPPPRPTRWRSAAAPRASRTHRLSLRHHRRLPEPPSSRPRPAPPSACCCCSAPCPATCCHSLPPPPAARRLPYCCFFADQAAQPGPPRLPRPWPCTCCCPCPGPQLRHRMSSWSRARTCPHRSGRRCSGSGAGAGSA